MTCSRGASNIFPSIKAIDLEAGIWNCSAKTSAHDDNEKDPTFITANTVATATLGYLKTQCQDDLSLGICPGVSSKF